MSVKLLKAITKNNRSKVIKLLNKGADPNFYEDKAKVRPLHLAAQVRNCSKDIIFELLIAGAKIDEATKNGITPTKVAKLHNNKKVLFLLKKIQSSINKYRYLYKHSII